MLQVSIDYVSWNQMYVTIAVTQSAIAGTHSIVAQSNRGPSNGIAFQVRVRLIAISMQNVYFQIGPAYNNYPEATNIRVTAVDANTGQILTLVFEEPSTSRRPAP